ncbi:MAG: aminoglycoside phosphotransferase family protein [Lentisphaerae bacterium]|nr:aminoglycoside phosphotransferase family protein [Lentisphaerota bacterium]
MRLTETQAGALADALLEQPGSRARRFGAGKFSEVFAVTCGTREYVLRVAPPDSVLQLFYEYRMMRQEPALHARLRSETGVPVPPILAHDFSRTRLARDFLIMPRLPGGPLSHAALAPAARDRALREWGRHVRDIHALTDPENRFGYLGRHRCMEPQPAWRDAFLLMYRKLLDDIAGCGVYDASTADDAQRLVEDHAEVFEACRASRLCHGDLWVTNLLVDGAGGVTGVLDFDRACWGDVEWDLAIAEYCGVTQDPFWEGYGRRVETHRGDAAVRRMFYLLYEHQKYIVISMSTRRNDPQGARRYANECLDVMARFRRTGRPRF